MQRIKMQNAAAGGGWLEKGGWSGWGGWRRGGWLEWGGAELEKACSSAQLQPAPGQGPPRTADNREPQETPRNVNRAETNRL